MLRLRIAAELAVLCVLTPLFLLYGPRNSSLYVTLAVLLVGFIIAGAKQTRQSVWGVLAASFTERLRRSAASMATLTAPVVLAFFLLGALMQHPVSIGRVLLVCCLYFPWALLQQTIFQFYLLGRLRALAPSAPSYLLSFGNGIAYGLVHAPHMGLVVLTSVAGMIWSYTYFRDRVLVPIAASHAVLGATYYSVFTGRDLITELVHYLTALLPSLNALFS